MTTGLQGRAVVRGASWSALESLGAQGISFLVFLLLARWLTPQDFGLVAMANLYVLVAQFFIFQGLGQAILQFEDLDDDHLQTVFWINVAVGLAFFLGTLGTARFPEAWFHAPGLGAVLRGLAPIFLLAALTDVQNNLLTRRMQFRALALRTLLSSGLGGIVAVVMAGRGFGAWSLVGQQLTVWSGNLVALWWASPWRPRWRFSLARARRLCAFGVHVLWADLVGLANRRLDQVFVARGFGPVSAGFYAVGARVATLVNEILIRSLSRVTVTVLARMQGEAERLRSAVYRIAEMQSAVIFPVPVGLALVAPEVVGLFFGSKWASAVPVMQVLLLACPFEALLALHQSVFIARGRPAWCSALATAHAATNLVFFTVAIRWGPVAIAAAYTLRAALLYPVELGLLRRVDGFSALRFARAFLPQAAALAVMAAAVVGVRWALGPAAPLLLLSISTLTGAVGYTLALMIFNRELVGELRRFGWQGPRSGTAADAPA